MGCCAPLGSLLPWDTYCPDCGAEIDIEGNALEICEYSPQEPCETCGAAMCDGSC